ncbi:helix-turn-helix domain-containing protein [Brevibacillus humidisoli]|uniref:helix-turn-helix transcriptional regulator n=1 Tax=Brevibacillus humidisoli TaxID=2895522 RepID=UPI001E596AB2|nr:helix-turn-helix domain-containing protein [Brevibacillus humidisoli]UFJ41240.1 helix-turn-helix domain-containing protein [Brevibacillus humidisoli]
MNIQVKTHSLDSLYESPNVRLLEENRARNQCLYELPLPFGSATVNRTCLRGGLEISAFEGVLTKQLPLRCQTMYPHLEFSYTLSGRGSWSGEGAPALELAPGVSTLVYMADHRVGAELGPDEHLSHLEVRFDLRHFEAMVTELRLTASGQFFSRQLAGNPQVAKLFEQLRDCAYIGALRQLYLEGKCYELLASHLAQFELAGMTGRARIGLSADDIRCLQRAREILTRSWRTPPGLLELARSVGINDYKLKRGFKELFGTTVFGYIRHLRMNEARRLLEAGKANVSQAAACVGYVNLSHFASAYRRTFGYNPSECQRRGQWLIATNR